jgi:DNA/RNA-binding domain of Phe-tRNA-synthetase-like protein
MDLSVEEHPSLGLVCFRTRFPAAIGAIPSPPWLTEKLRADAEAPVVRDDEARKLIRDVLRYGGYKPTGRGKPASEYLVRAAGEGKLGSINPAVDACNVVSLHSGLPISLIDLDRASGSLRIGIAAAGTRYVFNASGQEIDASGLVCLHDAEGPCANAVKDSQRTKTQEETRQTLTVVWGARSLEQPMETATAWYRELLERLGASTDIVTTTSGGVS